MKTQRIWFGCASGLALSMLFDWSYGFFAIMLPLFVLSRARAFSTHSVTDGSVLGSVDYVTGHLFVGIFSVSSRIDDGGSWAVFPPQMHSDDESQHLFIRLYGAIGGVNRAEFC